MVSYHRPMSPSRPFLSPSATTPAAHTSAHATAPQDAVATLLLPPERERVDAAGHGCYRTLHRESFDELLVDLRSQRVSAVFVSVSRYRTQDAPHVARLVREFPNIPAVAVLTAYEPRTTQAVLALGQHGVRALVDVRDPKGWRDLRQFIVTERAEAIEKLAIRRLHGDLVGASQDALRFFEALFLAPPRLTTVRQLARAMSVVPTTFMSRFFRAGLPTPKRYLAVARLVRAARMLENPGYSVTHVANQLEYSSPQSFSRHVGTILGCSASEFRKRFDGAAMLEYMRGELVLPHVDTFRTFEPFMAIPAWSVLRQPPEPAASRPITRGDG